jgi:uncharacterized protein (TIGR03083 family)
MTTIEIDAIPPVSREEAGAIAAAEYRRVVEQLRSLEGDDWSKPTDCELWDVRAMAGHTVGMMTDFTSLRNVMARMRSATKASKEQGVALVDAMTSLQVADCAAMTTDELIAHAEQHGPKAARWRERTPKLLRAMPMKEEVGGVPETWKMGYLFDTILTRDPWMHRVDIARATGREMHLTSEHDGRIVADVVAEWARRHGQPFTLTLTGPAGGEFAAGGGEGERIELDAVELCRILSGRAEGAGLLAQPVPF